MSEPQTEGPRKVVVGLRTIEDMPPVSEVLGREDAPTTTTTTCPPSR